MANQMTSTFVISEGHCKAMGSGVSGPARAETTEKTGEGVWPFSSLADVMSSASRQGNWLEWVQSSKKIMGFKPTVDFLRLGDVREVEMVIVIKDLTWDDSPKEPVHISQYHPTSLCARHYR